MRVSARNMKETFSKYNRQDVRLAADTTHVKIEQIIENFEIQKKKNKVELIKEILQDAASSIIKLDVRKGEYSYFKVRVKNPYVYQEIFSIVQEDADVDHKNEVTLVRDKSILKKAVHLGYYD